MAISVKHLFFSTLLNFADNVDHLGNLTFDFIRTLTSIKIGGVMGCKKEWNNGIETSSQWEFFDKNSSTSDLYFEIISSLTVCKEFWIGFK